MSKEPNPKAKRRRTNKDAGPDIIDCLAEDVVQLEDINADPNGESSKSQDKSALLQFIGFYNNHVARIESFNNQVIRDVTKKQIGLFCDYMIKNPDIGWQSTMNYLSSIRRQLEERHGVEIFKLDPIWYKNTRKRVTRAYVISCIQGTYLNLLQK